MQHKAKHKNSSFIKGMHKSNLNVIKYFGSRQNNSKDAKLRMATKDVISHSHSQSKLTNDSQNRKEKSLN